MLNVGFKQGEACFGWMYDPQVLAEARAAGVGKRIDVSLGGKLDAAMCGAPVTAPATVRAVTDGRWDASPGSAFYPTQRSIGPCVRLLIGGVDVLVAGRRQQSFDHGAFALAGIDVQTYKVVGLKSATHFRGGWAPIASKIITCEAPGWSSNDLDTFEPLRRHRVVRWPTNPSATYVHDAAAKL